jgi:2-(1,2-epoxy-1,2-dihydrophenyl)acetyl-CoA isomerase
VSDYTAVPGLHVDLTDGLLQLTLARPDKRNAIDDVMMYALIDVIDRAGRDEAVRAIVLSGEGEHFCAGADIIARNTAGGQKPRAGSIQRRLPSQAHRLIPVMLSVQTPLICKVHGWAAGIGLAFALAADVTVATEDARFWTPFAERGFTPDSGLTWLLPRRVGEVRARQMLLLSRVVSGAEAQEWGLIHAAVPADQLDAATDEVVQTLAAGPTVALGLSKWLMHTGRETDLDAQLRNEAFAMELSSRSEDFREGFAAFREKRSPGFSGR